MRRLLDLLLWAGLGAFLMSAILTILTVVVGSLTGSLTVVVVQGAALIGAVIGGLSFLLLAVQDALL